MDFAEKTDLKTSASTNSDPPAEPFVELRPLSDAERELKRLETSPLLFFARALKPQNGGSNGS